MSIKQSLHDIVALEISQLQSLLDYSWENFEELIEDIVTTKGKIVWCGMGKSGHICKKIVATMSSLGIASFFLHPAEALHGDLGVVQQGDLVVLVSKSGESEEMVGIMPSINAIGAKTYSITNSENNTLARKCQINIILPKVEEALFENIVPTSSTTQMLVVGDAIAVCVAKYKKFTQKDFSVFHPNGLLGKMLTLKASDLMKKGEENSVVELSATLQDAILEMCKKPVGCVCVADKEGALKGIFTDGDLRRLISSGDVIDNNAPIINYININPTTVQEETLIFDIVADIQKKTDKSFKTKVSVLPVLNNEGLLTGTLCVYDIIKIGMLQ
ncbi:MAG: KpsF/GutQ family sugar-phosphate isomerase [Bacillota bacterium]